MIDVIKGYAAVKHGCYWVGVIPGPHCAPYHRISAAEALADALELLKEAVRAREPAK